MTNLSEPFPRRHILLHSVQDQPSQCPAELVDLAEELEYPNDRFRVFLIKEGCHDIHIGRETRYPES